MSVWPPAFLVEVMGRSCGCLALMAGLTGGAEVVVIPGAQMEPDQVAVEFRNAYERGKAHALAVVAEGARNSAPAMARHFAEHHVRRCAAARPPSTAVATLLTFWPAGPAAGTKRSLTSWSSSDRRYRVR